MTIRMLTMMLRKDQKEKELTMERTSMRIFKSVLRRLKRLSEIFKR
jgi:hypothetical protein